MKIQSDQYILTPGFETLPLVLPKHPLPAHGWFPAFECMLINLNHEEKNYGKLTIMK
ncbi:MAG: hypothetical protein OEZ68_21820 [Gammaproteobacteria bacterium]|nr:hypothetical protein [Gammaproteobacteria bacterium]MDH5803437.1 hypothetical protein [Gammaproteobacteria bacterium]